jgi:hypothetical protein
MHSAWIAVVVIAVVVAVVIILNVVMRRKGYSIPGKTVVRCSKGHLFKTIWIEGGSLKAIRLGPTTRFQYCPIGKHWAIVHPVKNQDLTSEDSKSLSEELA